MKNFESEIESVYKIKLSNLFTSDEESLLKSRNRFSDIIKEFNKKFNLNPTNYFSVPGRTEISGNHTDHNHGKVIAASINLDSIACARKYNSVIEIFSEGYEHSFVVNIDNLEVIDSEAGTTNALIRGIASRFVQKGFNIGGFKACITSDVLKGSGLSSSASIEVLIGSILNHLYNDGNISPEEIAKIGQYAENVYFKKPCGLMDQMACAVGGIIAIDFVDSSNPIIEKLDFDFSSTGYKLIVVDTEGSHSNLTDEYSAIPNEMKQVANYFGKEYCSEITLAQLIPAITSIRNKLSDRTILRAIHFLEENKRVEQQKHALKRNEFDKFLQLLNESGNSSYKYLQNIYSSKKIEKQEVSLALALSDLFINENGKGACRVHGGGFAGTILVILPDVLVEKYKAFITKIFNVDSVKILSIRQTGAAQILLD